MIEQITSVKNPLAQRLRALKDKKGREAQGLFLVEGEMLIREALLAGLSVREALIEQERLESQADLAQILMRAGAQVVAASRHVLEAVCDTMTPNGVCAAFEPPQRLDLNEAPRRLVALDALQDPGNVGTIWRTADAAGLLGLILGAGCPDPLSPKVQRGAMGSGFRLPACQTESLCETLRALQGLGHQIVTTQLDGIDMDLRPQIGGKFVLVIGSEARGVSAEIAQLADIRLRLPMRGGAESLNAAVAAGIVMYELMRGQ